MVSTVWIDMSVINPICINMKYKNTAPRENNKNKRLKVYIFFLFWPFFFRGRAYGKLNVYCVVMWCIVICCVYVCWNLRLYCHGNKKWMSQIHSQMTSTIDTLYYNDRFVLSTRESVFRFDQLRQQNKNWSESNWKWKHWFQHYWIISQSYH